MSRSDDPLTPLVMVLIAVFFLILILIPLLTMTLFHGTSMGGMMGSPTGAAGIPVGSLLTVVGIVLIAVVLVATFLRGSRREVVYVPHPVPVVPPEAGWRDGSPPATHPTATPDAPPPTPAEDLERWALRLLEGDERRLFREVMTRGGVALQKDLGVEAGFSRAKVTRLLEKLENKGLVVKERAGMTNRVRIVIREGG